MTQLRDNKYVFLLDCSHIFHINCLDALEIYDLRERKTCPYPACQFVYTKVPIESKLLGPLPVENRKIQRKIKAKIKLEKNKL